MLATRSKFYSIVKVGLIHSVSITTKMWRMILDDGKISLTHILSCTESCGTAEQTLTHGPRPTAPVPGT
ncbi:hypothetical protein AV530_000653 [Patagioenas fasciata monilis]|uniref:Uncharacterized protein n=1 Tax=Patagioenas fasciata monilis TaxID=372326 RepID=A0A1V4IGD7_PATFA|nr:hypothetical protein AV530_000653 [Patagioenas fasciata monilis]